MENVKHTGHIIAYDDYFTYFKLAKNLLANGLFSVGNVRPQRKYVPQMQKAIEKLERDVSVFLTKEGVATVKWMDNKDITLLSTTHNSAIKTSVNRTKKMVLKKKYLV